LIGDHRWAVSIRRGLGGVSESTGAVIAIAALAVLALIWWSPGQSFDRWITALVMIALVIGGVVAFFSQVAAERHELEQHDDEGAVTP
jgi:O-antigen ligase